MLSEYVTNHASSTDLPKVLAGLGLHPGRQRETTRPLSCLTGQIHQLPIKAVRTLPLHGLLPGAIRRVQTRGSILRETRKTTRPLTLQQPPRRIALMPKRVQVPTLPMLRTSPCQWRATLFPDYPQTG